MQLFRNSPHLVSFILALGARKATAIKIEPGQPAVDCDPKDRYYLNATGASILNDPFRTPTGPLSNGSKEWTWSVGTESYTNDTSTTPNVTSIRQILWLDTDPIQIYKTRNLGYLGCGLLIHGLKQSTVAKGQNHTSGTCGSVLSDACSATLLSVTAEIGTIASDSNAEPIEQICDLWQLNTDWGKQGAPPECADTFEKWAWIEGFPFTSPQIPPPCNGATATFQNSSNGGFDVRGSAAPIVAWGQSTYSTTNLTAYNNLTTSITPLISVMFVNHTTDGNSTEGYSQSQLVCLRPSNVQEGSVKPSALPTSDGGQQRFDKKWLWLAVVGLTCISTVS